MLGVFLPNSSWAFWPTTAATGTQWTYEYNRELVIRAEKAGFAFAFPAARWKGLDGDQIVSRGASLDTTTLTAGLLEATTSITILATMHTNVFNPVVAAKLCATLDHISGGRFGLNIVSGWQRDEFESMSIPLLDHKERYEYTREWLTIVRSLWATGECTFEGRFLNVKQAAGRPLPIQAPHPLIVNAGQSYTGMRFAAEEADYIFSRGSQAGKFREIAQTAGRSVGFIGTRKIIIRNTRAEAEALADEIVARHDAGAIHAEIIANGSASPDEAAEKVKDPTFVRSYLVGDAVIGGPADVARELADWITETRVSGVCLTFFDYLEDLQLFESKVKPLLARMLDDSEIELLGTDG